MGPVEPQTTDGMNMGTKQSCSKHRNPDLSPESSIARLAEQLALARQLRAAHKLIELGLRHRREIDERRL